MNNNFSIKFATSSDAAIILDFIKALATHLNSLDHVTATVDDIRESIFVQHQAEVLLAYECETPVGFALFYHHYSSFAGSRGLFLEDLYVLDSTRGKGYGKALLLHLAKIASERGCPVMDWNCLDWNKDSRDFYVGLGANLIEGQLTYRFNTDKLTQISKEEL